MAVGIIDGGGSGDKAGVTSTNRLKADNFPSSNFNINVALGLIEGVEFRSVFGSSDVDEGIVNEQVLGDGMTVRYPFPSSPAQMTLVSDSTADDSGGTGAEMILVRGNIADNVELFEIILLDGTSPVTTVNSYRRINSIVVVSVGSGGKNAGTITIKNSSDLLAQINPGNNISRTAIYSVPDGISAVLNSFELLTGKDDNGVSNLHLFPTSIGNIDLLPISQRTYQNLIKLGTSAFLLESGTDIEITGYSEISTGLSNLSGLFELTLVNNA